MSLCCKLRQWFQKHKKPTKQSYQQFLLRDFYNPICFEKTLRQYDHPSLKKAKSSKSFSKTPFNLVQESAMQNEQKNAENIPPFIQTVGGLYQNQKQNVSEIKNEVKNSYMDEEDDDDQFFNSLHLIEEERSEHSDMLISEKSQNLILRQINPKQDEEILLLNGQPIFSIPLEPLEQSVILLNNENDKQNKKVNDNKENSRFNDEKKTNNEVKKNNSQQVPNIKTKLSVRMLNKKLRKGATLKNLAKEILKRRTIELDGTNNSPNTEVVYEAILAFMEQELSKRPS